MVIEFVVKFLLKICSAYILADFLVGIYHWVKDTYFGPFTPIIGKKFIWSSRLHHIRPRYVLEFSDWELFSDSAKWTLLWMGPLFYLRGFSIFNVVLYLSISMNDVIHKYAHMFDNERPKWATLMQRAYIFQSHEEHHLHHTYPHEINYCPMTPYVNVFLEKINMWTRLENTIEYTTGIKPRAKEYDFVEDNNYPAGVKFINE